MGVFGVLGGWFRGFEKHLVFWNLVGVFWSQSQDGQKNQKSRLFFKP
jgi:hypothetical protein